MYPPQGASISSSGGTTITTSAYPKPNTVPLTDELGYLKRFTSTPLVLDIKPPIFAAQQFGVSVDISADKKTMVIGANTYSSGTGRAYVYRRSELGWVHFQTLDNPDSTTQSDFGYVVKISRDGSRIAVSAYLYDNPSTGNTNEGKVYIFKYDGTQYVLEASLSHPEPQASAWFGHSIDFDDSGEILAVGTPFQNGTNTGEGKVYIFRFNGTNWVLSQAVTHPESQSYARFGFSVSLAPDGTKLAVGAILQDGINFDEGKVYVFRFDGTSWVLEASLANPDPRGNAQFGYSVLLLKDMLFVGAINNIYGGYVSGKAYRFDFDGTNWNKTYDFGPPNGQSYMEFGAYISASKDGNVVAISAPKYDGIYVDEGRVYVFRKVGNVYTIQACLVPLILQETIFAKGYITDDGTEIAVGVTDIDLTAIAQGAVWYFFDIYGGDGSANNADYVRGFPADFTKHFQSWGGYQRFPSGLMLQWGTFVTGTSTTNVVTGSAGFPLTFPRGVFQVVATPVSAPNASWEAVTVRVTSVSTSGFSYLVDTTDPAQPVSQGVQIRYIAIGW